MAKKEEKEPAFKVIDRRGGDQEGQVRDTKDAFEPKKEPTPQSANKPKESESSHSNELDAWENERQPINFSLFCQSLAHQAMMGLGLVPWPDSGLVQERLELAKETIDILDILQKKTKGNLDTEEKALLDTLLYQLRMTYVSLSSGVVPPPTRPGNLKVS